jgi:BirA family biotin operon repressor/biotin-[acetyl-CoA-carboxylase] ligase
MKSHILEILKTSSEEAVSGESLSARLSVSRVAVWKHIQKLREYGYPIESNSKGYTLKDGFDVMSPWEFPGWEDRIHYYPEVDSTMDVARDLARKGCPSYTVTAAGRQLKGRGRLDRNWASIDGGLYFTMTVRPELPPMLVHRVNFCASLTLAKTLRDRFDVRAMVKWPNDILVGEKKLAGMLSEMETRSDMVSFLNIGIGINVNNDPRSVAPEAASLRRIMGNLVPRKMVLSAFIDAFRERMEKGDLSAVIDEWKAYTMTIGRRVRVATVKDVFEGRAVDVDADGALILETGEGERRRVVHGDCFHQNQSGGKTENDRVG